MVMAFIVAAAFLTIADAAEPVPTPPLEPALTGKGNYGRPFEPPTRSAFIPLPPGAVEPEGWLRDWCLAQEMDIRGTWTMLIRLFNRRGPPTTR